jgi:hypothetical protein
LEGIDAERAIKSVAGLEPIVVDEKLVAIEVGGLRIYPDRGSLRVSERIEDEQ